MNQHEGIIEIIRIENKNIHPGETGTLTARFVRYSGSQQLSLWLPENARMYIGNFRIVALPAEHILEENSVADYVNGSVLLTWDTLLWPPGEYRLEIPYPTGGMHVLNFKKWPENAIFPKEKIIEMPVATAQHPSLISGLLAQKQPKKTDHETLWGVYKDRHGDAIPNTDQVLRDDMNARIKKIMAKLLSTTGPRLEYEGTFRGGNIIYIEGEVRLSFWHEMGGGACKMYIDIPDEATWEQRTSTPVSRRAEILRFIANTVKREQAPSWRYEIGDREIAYY